MSMITSINKDELNDWLKFVKKREEALHLLQRLYELEIQKTTVLEKLVPVTRYLADNKHMLKKFKNSEELIKGIRIHAGL